MRQEIVVFQVSWEGFFYLKKTCWFFTFWRNFIFINNKYFVLVDSEDEEDSDWEDEEDSDDKDEEDSDDKDEDSDWEDVEDDENSPKPGSGVSSTNCHTTVALNGNSNKVFVIRF